jgi:hypothetical protein
MNDSKRATIYFDPQLHRALKLKAADGGRSVSEIVNDAVRLALDEDAADFQAIEDRRDEPTIDFATVVKDLKHRGML